MPASQRSVETLGLIAATFGVDLAAPSPIVLSGASRLVQLPDLFKALGFSSGAEIGVEQGKYSELLCQRIPGLRLLCVDAWRAYGGYREHVTQRKLDGFYQATLARLARYGCDVVPDFSVEAAKRVPDRSLDFVYIDGNHTLPHVIADIAAWAPKVRPGGVVAGHDFGRSSVGHVREAVLAWTAAYRVAPWFLLTADRSQTWMWVQR